MKPLLINGAWTETTHAVDNVNPSNVADIIDRYAQAGISETQDAIAAARHAFPGWASSTPQKRHDILKAAGDEIMARKDEIGRLFEPRRRQDAA